MELFLSHGSAVAGETAKTPDFSRITNDQMRINYSDLMYTSLGEHVSADERHELASEMRRRGLIPGFMETPRYLREKQQAERARPPYSVEHASLIEWAKGKLADILKT